MEFVTLQLNKVTMHFIQKLFNVRNLVNISNTLRSWYSNYCIASRYQVIQGKS